VFKLIRVNDLTGNVVENFVENGEVNVLPEANYLYNESDPTDKRKKIRFGKYYKTQLKCRFVASKDEYNEVYAFLNESELVNDLDTGLGLYLWFTDKDDTVYSYPIFDILEQPDMTHKGRFFNAEYEFILESIYENTPHLPDFLNFGDGNFGDGNFGY
jgi:hypothetical protein